MFFFIYAWINDWVKNREVSDLRRQRGHYDIVVMNMTDILFVYYALLLFPSINYADT